MSCYEALYDKLARRKGRLTFDDLPLLLDEKKGAQAPSAALDDELASNYPGVFKEQIMAESWRSRPAVLELVNRICAPDTNPALSDPGKFSRAARQRWQYDRHVPEQKRQSEPGYAAVLLAAKADEDEATDAETETGGDLADKLAAQARVIKAVFEKVRPLERGLTCAILVRKNKSAEAVAQWLSSHGVPQVMVEGVATLAEQSPLVEAQTEQPVETPWGEGELQWEHGSRDFGAPRKDAPKETGPIQLAAKLLEPVPHRKRRKPSAAGHDSLAQAAPTAVSSGGLLTARPHHSARSSISDRTPVR